MYHPQPQHCLNVQKYAKIINNLIFKQPFHSDGSVLIYIPVFLAIALYVSVLCIKLNIVSHENKNEMLSDYIYMLVWM